MFLWVLLKQSNHMKTDAVKVRIIPHQYEQKMYNNLSNPTQIPTLPKASTMAAENTILLCCIKILQLRLIELLAQNIEYTYCMGCHQC